MATESPVPALVQPRSGTEQLAAEWRRLTRVATVVAVLTAPAAFVWLHQVQGWSVGWSLLGTFLEVIAFRGLVDVVLRRFIPWPSLFGAEESLREEDVVARRRVWFWRRWFRLLLWLVVIGVVVYGINLLLESVLGADWLKSALGPSPGTAFLALIIQMPILLIANFAIFFGPFLLMAVSQIRSYEPGDADWGVKLEDVRGQAEAKEEVRQVVTLWQSGEAFERAGGKRERGLLMLGAPGTGKTMLSKAIATGFNCPFVSIPGSGFAGMFLGMDAITVRLPRPPREEARGQVGRPVHRLHRRDRRRRPAPVEPRCRRVHDRRPAGDDGGAVLLRPQRFAHAQRRPRARDAGVAGTALHRARRGHARGPVRPRGDREPHLPGRRRDVRGRSARAEPAPGRDGRDRGAAVHAQAPDPYAQHVPRRDLRDPSPDRPHAAAPQEAAPGRRADLLHRRLQRPARISRPRARPAGADGSSRVVPDPDQGRPEGHLRPVPGQGHARGGSRLAEAARRALADHERLLAGDGRAGVLDGPHDRALRRPDGVRVGRHRRGDDHGRVGHRRQRRVHPRRRRGPWRFTRRATRSPGTST